jgi:hypothetical protein
MNKKTRSVVSEIFWTTKLRLGLHYSASDIDVWSSSYHGTGNADELVDYCKGKVKNFEEIYRHVELLNA